MTVLAHNEYPQDMLNKVLSPPCEYDVLTDMIKGVPIVPMKQKCKETLRVLFSYPEAECMVVCDEDQEPVGLINCSKFYLRLISGAGLDRLYMEPVIKLMNRNLLIVDAGSEIQAVREAIASRSLHAQEEFVVVTIQGKLCGVIKVSDVMSI